MGYYNPTQTTINKDEATIYASVIVVSSFLIQIMEHAYIIHFEKLSLTTRVACTSLIYRKSLKLSKSALNEITVGHIINLLTNDMQQLVDFWPALHAIWAAPLQAGIILSLMYWTAGPTALIGCFLLVVLTPLQRKH